MRSPKLPVAFSQSSYILMTYRVVAVTTTDQFGCANSMTLTDCQIRGIGIDDVNDKVYYSYVAKTCSVQGEPCLVVGDDPSLPANERAMIATQIRSMDKDGSNDALVYRAVFYERSGSGPWDASYFGSFTLDLAHRDFYISTYKGNSAERSILRLTMDPEQLGQNVYLYGHPSIPHSMIAENVYAEYQGPDRYLSNDGETVEGNFEVVLPKVSVSLCRCLSLSLSFSDTCLSACLSVVRHDAVLRWQRPDWRRAGCIGARRC